jgi:hypothetical protein
VLREFAANGYGLFDLSAGEFELAIIGASGVDASITRIGDRP